jgi:SAM-dependent methyltransferase
MTPATKCHSCGNAELTIFYEAPQVPVHSCLMVSTRAEALAFPRGDLGIGFCPRCGFIQNTAFDPSMERYSTDYEETQGFSPRFMEFAKGLCASQIEKYDLRDKDVLEIGCGKGEFLVLLCEMGKNRGIGIDPGYRPERTQSDAASRLQFVQDFYSEKYAHLKADYVCCRHTLEHIQPVSEFVRMIRRTIDNGRDVVVFFEVPDTERVLEEQAFWDIYYEHCSYFTLGSLARLFRASDFEILDLYKDYDDQYLMIECRAGNTGQGRRFEEEDDLDRTARQVEVFGEKIGDKLAGLRTQLADFNASGRRVVLWGSGSKAVSYLTTLGIADDLEYIVDINPHKHGKFLAGTGHEIVAPEFLTQYKPDVVIVMNPIYCDEIRADLGRLGLSPQVIALS